MLVLVRLDDGPNCWFWAPDVLGVVVDDRVHVNVTLPWDSEVEPVQGRWGQVLKTEADDDYLDYTSVLRVAPRAA